MKEVIQTSQFKKDIQAPGEERISKSWGMSSDYLRRMSLSKKSTAIML